jgi:hypothetical protein
MKHLKLFEAFLLESASVFYHGTPDSISKGAKGIHIGTKRAATEALEARIGVPAEGEWDGTREYGKTLLAGRKKFMKDPAFSLKHTGYNAGREVPEEDYYPTERTERAEYSDGTKIPFDAKPVVFKVKIKGQMSNSPSSPHSDSVANGLMKRSLNKGNARKGFYYVNDAEDEGSISAVVPDASFLSFSF